MGVPGAQAREKEDMKVEASGERDAEGRGGGVQVGWEMARGGEEF